MAASQWSARWPAGNWYVAAPRPMTFVWYYAVLLAVFTGWIFRARRKRLVLAALLLLSALWVADWQQQRGAARLDVLALRGAPAVFARASGTEPRPAGGLRRRGGGGRDRQAVSPRPGGQPAGWLLFDCRLQAKRGRRGNHLD